MASAGGTGAGWRVATVWPPPQNERSCSSPAPRGGSPSQPPCSSTDRPAEQRRPGARGQGSTAWHVPGSQRGTSHTHLTPLPAAEGSGPPRGDRAPVGHCPASARHERRLWLRAPHRGVTRSPRKGSFVVTRQPGSLHESCAHLRSHSSAPAEREWPEATNLRDRLRGGAARRSPPLAPPTSAPPAPGEPPQGAGPREAHLRSPRPASCLWLLREESGCSSFLSV